MGCVWLKVGWLKVGLREGGEDRVGIGRYRRRTLGGGEGSVG